MDLTNQPKTVLKMTLASLCLGIGLAPAYSQSLLLDFGPTSVASPYLTLSPGHSTGAVSTSDTGWNKISTSAANTSLTYGDGSAATGLTLTLGQEATIGNNIINYSTAVGNLTLAGTGGAVPGQKSLLTPGSIYGDDTSSTAVGRDGFFGSGTGAAGAAIGLRIDGLATGTYSIFVMARNVNSDVAASPMNIYAATAASASTFSFSSLAASPESNIGYTTAAYVNQYNSFVNGENYIGESFTITAGDSLFLAVDGGSASETRGFLNAVEISPAPEPGTCALLALGFCVLGATFGKRKIIS
jgi:hypothetical protein